MQGRYVLVTGSGNNTTGLDLLLGQAPHKFHLDERCTIVSEGLWGDIWYESGEARWEAVMTEAESADSDCGSPGKLRKVNEPRVWRECMLYMARTLIVGEYFCCDLASRNVIGDALSSRRKYKEKNKSFMNVRAGGGG